MTRVEYLKQQISEMRDSGAEPEDIAQVVQELNMEMAKALALRVEIEKGGGKAQRRKKKDG